MMRYSLACLSDVGLLRKHNEDNFVFFGNVLPIKHQSSSVYTAEIASNESFAVGIFDGMGGEADGEYASYSAAKAFESNARLKRWTRDDVLKVFADMESAVCEEHDARRAKSMGTTATIVIVDGSHAYVGNVGDSPALLYSNGELRVLSREHTDAEILKLLGVTGRRSRLTQFLGMSDGEVSPSPHITDFEVRPGDTILLVSDGLTELLDESAICDALASSGKTSDRVKLLRDMAIHEGGYDNITVLLCEAAESELNDWGVIE